MMLSREDHQPLRKLTPNRVALIGALALILLSFVPFSNPYDNNYWIFLSSQFVSNQPPFSRIGWPGGFFYVFPFEVMSLPYWYFSFNIYPSLVLLKTVFLGFTVLTGLACREIARREGLRFWSWLPALILLNPAVIFINYIWIEPDIVFVFFLAIFFLLWRQLQSSRPVLGTAALLAVICLLLAVFSYYLALVMLPTLAIYAGGWRRRGHLFLIGGSSLAVGFVVQTLFFRGLYDYLGALNSGIVGDAGTQGLQWFISLGSGEYLALLFMIALVLPLILKRLKVSEVAAIYVVLILFVFSSKSTYADDYMWAVPFLALIAARSAKTLRGLWVSSMLLTSVFIVGIVSENFVAGYGSVQGVFYWGYLVFHTNYMFIQSAQAYMFWLWGSNLSLLVSAIGCVALALWLDYLPSKGAQHERLDEHGSKWNPISRATPSPASVPSIGRRKSQAVTWLCTALVVVALASILSGGLMIAETTSGVTQNNVQVFPVNVLWPGLYPSGNWVMEGQRNTYQLVGNQAILGSQSSPIAFGRPTTDQLISARFSEMIVRQGNEHGTFKVLRGSNFNVSVSYTANATVVGSKLLVPVPNQLTPVANVTVPSTNLIGPIYSLKWNDTLVYSQPMGNTSSSNLFFAFDTSEYASAQTVVMTMEAPQARFQVTSSPNDTYAALYMNGSWEVTNSIPTGHSLATGWIFVEVSAVSHGLSVSIDGTSALLPTGNYNLSWQTATVGAPFGNTAYSFTGNVSGLFHVQGVLVKTSALYRIASVHSSIVGEFDSAAPFNFSVREFQSDVVVSFLNRSTTIDGQSTFIQVGKFEAGAQTAVITCHGVSLYPKQTGPFTLATAFAFAVPPALAALWIWSRFPPPGESIDSAVESEVKAA